MGSQKNLISHSAITLIDNLERLLGVKIDIFVLMKGTRNSKRDIGIKDSGNIIPGHGGVMDRFDGYFLILPFYNVYLVNWL